MDDDPVDIARQLNEQSRAESVIANQAKSLPWRPFRYQFFDWERVRQDVYKLLVKR